MIRLYLNYFKADDKGFILFADKLGNQGNVNPKLKNITARPVLL